MPTEQSVPCQWHLLWEILQMSLFIGDCRFVRLIAESNYYICICILYMYMYIIHTHIQWHFNACIQCVKIEDTDMSIAPNT